MTWESEYGAQGDNQSTKNEAERMKTEKPKKDPCQGVPSPPLTHSLTRNLLVSSVVLSTQRRSQTKPRATKTNEKRNESPSFSFTRLIHSFNIQLDKDCMIISISRSYSIHHYE